MNEKEKELMKQVASMQSEIVQSITDKTVEVNSATTPEGYKAEAEALSKLIDSWTRMNEAETARNSFELERRKTFANNSLEESKLAIERERVEAEKAAVKADRLKAILSATADFAKIALVGAMFALTWQKDEASEMQNPARKKFFDRWSKL